jgi:hypothetical protein
MSPPHAATPQSESFVLSSTPQFNHEQLTAVRNARWHQAAGQPGSQTGDALLTLEDARTWISELGLVLFAPRAHQLPAPAPSLVEATLGRAAASPSAAETDTARSLVARLTAEGAAIPLNLLGGPGDTPDFIASTQVFGYIFTLRGDKNWKQPPATSGAVKVSPLALKVYELLAEGNAMSAAEIVSELGRELTENAILRALNELWSQLRVIPLLQQDGSATTWELTTRRFTKQIKAGANAGQPTALSALISLYLAQAYAALEDEIETFLSPLAARSRIREVLHGLTAARQLEPIVLEGKRLLYIPGALPEFPEIAAEQPAEGEVPTETAAAKPEERIRRFDRPRTSRTDRPRTTRDDRPGRPDRKPRPFGGDRDRPAKPFGDRPRAPRAEGKSFGDRPRSPRPFGDKPRAPRGEGKSFGDRPRPSRPFGDKPRAPRGEGKSFGDRPRSPRPFGDKPRAPRAEGKSFGDRPRSPRPFGDKPRAPRAEGKSFGDRPRPSRPFGDKPRAPRAEGKSFGDRERRPFQRNESRPARPAFTRPWDEDRKPREPRPGSEGERPQRDRERPRPQGDRPPRRDANARPSSGRGDFRPRPDRGERPSREGRAPRPEGRDRPFRPRPAGAEGTRPQKRFRKPDEGRGDAPERSGPGSKPAGKRTFGAKPFGKSAGSFGKSAGGVGKRASSDARPARGPNDSRPPRGVNPRKAGRAPRPDQKPKPPRETEE